jgi:membrane protein implicated in regulation of membrane protease activity
MLVVAHAGHWLVQLVYLVPLAVLVAVIVAGRVRDRRDAAREQGHPQERE